MVLSAPEAHLLALVKRFVTRQRLVKQLIRELRPYLLAKDPEAHRPGRSAMLATAKGTWGAGGEWQFRMHGPGCKMKSQRTGEPLDWDAPVVKRFNAHRFLLWVEWHWIRPKVSRHLVALHELALVDARGLEAVVLAGLKALAKEGVLQAGEDDGFDYVLISPPRRALPPPGRVATSATRRASRRRRRPRSPRGSPAARSFDSSRSSTILGR